MESDLVLVDFAEVEQYEREAREAPDLQLKIMQFEKLFDTSRNTVECSVEGCSLEILSFFTKANGKNATGDWDQAASIVEDDLLVALL